MDNLEYNLEKLQVKSGDVIVFKTKINRISAVCAEALSSRLKSFCPGVLVIVVPDDMDVSILRPEIVPQKTVDDLIREQEKRNGLLSE